MTFVISRPRKVAAFPRADLGQVMSSPFGVMTFTGRKSQ